ncbi:MAG: BolA family protein [Rhodobacterales bacterium]|nr:BolA family protein [Rhodobacterales bacterium]
MQKSEEIKNALMAAFAVDHLEVINESAQHAGHAGHDGSGESHFKVVIKAPEFAAMGRLARHRAIHAALGADLIAQIHALSLDVEG